MELVYLVKQRIIITSFFLSLFTFLFAQQKEVKVYYGQDSLQKKRLEKTYHISKDKQLSGEYIEYYYEGGVKVKGQYQGGEQVGIWHYFYESQQKRQNIEVLPNGVKIFTLFYENGKPKGKYHYKGKEKNGFVIQYFESGEVKSNGYYKNGLKDSTWTAYNEEGLMMSRAQYHNGEGVYKGYYHNGNPKMKGPIRKNWSEGVWTYYYEAGGIQSKGLEVGGVKNGVWTFYTSSGEVSSEGEYHQGKPHGKWKYFYKNGSASAQGLYADGFRDKAWNLYHEGGEVKAKGDFDKGYGKYTEFYPSRKIKIKGFFKKDLYDSLWTYYYDDGTLEGECIYCKGEGFYRGYYKNGTVKMQGQLHNGERTGVWEFYDKKGKLDGKLKTVYNNKDPEINPNILKKDSVTNRKVVLPDLHINKKSGLQKNLEKIYHFKPRLREYSGVILGTNPLSILANNELIFYAEKYWQERLGYEFQAQLYRTPWLKSLAKVREGEITKIGWAIAMKQKLYHQEESFGMYYYAHGVRISHLTYRVNNNTSSTYRLKQESYEYVLYIGDRVLRDVHGPGVTVDVYFGLGAGYRKSSISDINTEQGGVFNKIANKAFYIPIRFGGSLGYVF